ncbi:MAG: metallophosphoesterase [Oscillospiraceae bacterium]|nr:metallophosphoesterase [Oscillospiraceae bacterium]
MLKFHLITDTHYYAYDELGHNSHKDQVTLNENGAVLDAVFDKLLASGETDIVLIAGDLCNDGRAVNHFGFLKKLRRLQEGGKRVFVITASHDYSGFNPEDTKDAPGGEARVSREELLDLYYDFGFRQALAVYEPDPLSYVALLAPGYRLVCINGDKFSPGLYEWAASQVRSARAEGDFVFAMHHYPLVPPSPIYPLLSPGKLFDDFGGAVSGLADAGLRFVFTGHTHMQNISSVTTAQGGRLYEINTGAAVGYPAPIRFVTVDEQQMSVTTQSIDDFAWDLQGKTVRQYLSDHFDQMLNDIFDAAGSDVGRLLDLLNNEFRVNKQALMRYRLPLSMAGRFLNRVTLGGAGRLLLCYRKIPHAAKKVRLRELMIEIVRNIYGGDEPYSRGTAVGEAVYILTGRLERLLSPVLSKVSLPFESLQGFVMSLIYDPTPDTEAVLPLYDGAEQLPAGAFSR